MLARRAKLNLLYQGVDISEDISTDLNTATWVDKSDKEADEITVNLKNEHGKWAGDWFPSKGAKLVASIEVLNWGAEGNSAILPCGTFEIDQIELTGGDGSKVSIKAVSVPITSRASGNKKTKSWQDVKLSMIAGEIAKNANLALFFELDEDPEYQNEVQAEETDLNFLQGLCADAGASLKVSHGKIVIFSQEKREQADAVLTITPQMAGESYRFTSKSANVYKSAKVEYHDPEADEDFEYEYEAEPADLSGEDENDRVLVINERVKSLSEAETLAKNSLRDKNKFEVTGSFSCIGDVRLVAGVNVQMSGFGKFDGKYAIDTATHTIGAGYKVSVEMRRGPKKTQKKDTYKEPGWRDFSAYGEDFFK